MKNRVLAAGIIATFFIATFSCGRPHSQKQDENSKIEKVSSRELALQTIKESIGEVQIKNDYAYYSRDLVENVVEGMVVESTEPGIIYKAWIMNYPVEEPYVVGFCFENDSKIVWAEECSKDFVSQGQVDLDYKNEQHHTAKNYNGAFAWNYADCATAIIGLENEYACSSVWAWDTEANSVSLVWYNNQLENIGYENT